MIYVIVGKDNVVVECISVDSVDQLTEIYTEHKIIERTGDETVGWKYDGVGFIAPPVW